MFNGLGVLFIQYWNHSIDITHMESIIIILWCWNHLETHG